MTTKPSPLQTVRVPATWALDAENREVIELVRRGKRTCTLAGDVATLREALGDADFYSDPSQFAPECRWMCRSAKRAAAVLRRELARLQAAQKENMQ